MRSLSFLHCSRVPRCDAIVDKKFGYYTLQMMTQGELEVRYDDQEYALSGSWLWPSFPGPHIRFHTAPECPFWEHRYVAFQGTLVDEWIGAGLWLEAPQPLPHARVIKLFDELLVHALRGDNWGARRATNLLEQILLELAEARIQAPRRAAWLEIVLQKLDEENQFAPDYERLAHECGMGSSTLRRNFKKVMGITLHTYVMTRRVARAKELLSETNWPLKEIAAHLKFSDTYFFSAQFRKLTGVAPAAYRKSRQT